MNATKSATAEDIVINSSSDTTGEDWDTLSDTVPASALGPRKDTGANRPDISRLPDAIGPDGTPLFVRGDKVVIERYSGILAGKPYLDTRTFLVESVDPITGKVHLYDQAIGQYAMDNWKAGVSNGNVYKFARANTIVASKRKRGRPRKNTDAPTNTAPKPTLGTDGKPVAKKRGRPAGVKNRPKDIIVAEKKAKLEVKRAKAKKRAAKATTIKKATRVSPAKTKTRTRR